MQLPLPILPISLTPVTLTGRLLRLEPLTIHHSRGLFSAATPEVFHYLYIQPTPWTPEGFEAYINTLNADPTRVPLAVIHQPTDTVIGSSGFLGIRPNDRSAEIGTTWYSAAHQGTLVNPECKFLMLRHLFETVGCQRMWFRVDTRNSRSMAAVTKLGARLDGVLRRMSIDRFGYARDMAEFSILSEEWPPIKAGLIARLGYGP
jgi:RimJ/RimL family protein N-acetyltransferase